MCHGARVVWAHATATITTGATAIVTHVTIDSEECPSQARSDAGVDHALSDTKRPECAPICSVIVSTNSAGIGESTLSTISA